MSTRDELKTNKMRVVMWSGGHDSTLLLYELAKKYGTKENPIHAVSIYYKLFPSAKNDRNAREKLKKVFKKRNLNIKFHEIKLPILNMGIGYSHNPKLPQPTYFLFALSQFYTISNIDFYFGYVRGDDFWYSRDKFVSILMGASEMSSYQEDVNVYFPLEFITKEQIISLLKKYSLYQYCWYCQGEDVKSPCGKCPSCEKVLKANWWLRQNKPPNYSTYELSV